MAKSSYERLKRWRQAHPGAYRAQSAKMMRDRRADLTDDYIIGLLRNMGFTEFPPEVVAAERLRLKSLRAAGLYQKKKK